jgi:hypothetical protein
MARLIASIFLFLVSCISAEAAGTLQSCTKALGYTQITSLTSATGLGTIPSGTFYVVITIETAGIRWRDDGTAPTASVGMPVNSGATFSYTASFSKFQMIQQTSGAVADVYFCGSS